MIDSPEEDKAFVQKAFADAQPMREELARLLARAQTGTGTEDEKKALFSRIGELTHHLERQRPLIEERVSPFERLLSLSEQYDRQYSLLEQKGILVPIGGGKKGIETVVEGQKVPIPTRAEVIARLRAINRREPGESKAFLERKIDQGFGKPFFITPFGMSLVSLDSNGTLDMSGYSLASIYAKTLLKKSKAKLLCYTKRNVSDTHEIAEPIPENMFKEAEPLYIAPEYKGPTNRGADKEGTMVYFPNLFDPDPAKHKGIIKPDILVANPANAWIITLAESQRNIPRQGNAQLTGADRNQIDTSGTQIREYIVGEELIPDLNEYLEALKGTNPDNTLYKGERGQTPDEGLWEAITIAELENQVLHDYMGNGSINYLLSAYFPGSGQKGRVPSFGWNRDVRQARLGWSVPVNRLGRCGVRSVAGESPIGL